MKTRRRIDSCPTSSSTPASRTPIRDTLEALIDRTSLATVVDLLAELASTKAYHIRETWQDDPLADVWDNAAKELIVAATMPNITAVSR